MVHCSLIKKIRRSYQPKLSDIKLYIASVVAKKYTHGSITVMIVDEAMSKDFNLEYRHKNNATNVISLEYPNKDNPMFLGGEIILCDSVIFNEAKEQDKSVKSHYAHMIIHGLLHIQGYDHITMQDATIMENIEIQTLHNLGFDNPYKT